MPIRYPNAIFDEDEQRWVSDAEVAEIAFTAFTNRRKAEHATARLIVRLVRRLNPATVPAGQSEMIAVYRYHAVFTDNPGPMADAEATHRDHAIIEQVIADLKDSALAHLPSGMFAANAVWLTCAAIAHNLSRSAGALASAVHARARTGTIRAQLIHGPRSDHSLRTPPCAAPATGLALGTRPRRAVPPSPPRLPPHPGLTTAPPRADRRPPVEEWADRRTTHA